MKTKDFDFQLPQELIAQTPLEKRDHSRLLTLNREKNRLEHHLFYQLPQLLQPGDLLVLNDSRVIPARLHGKKIPGGAGIQFLLLEEKEQDVWEILVRPGRKARPGDRFSFGEGKLVGEILDIVEGGNRLARFTYEGEFMAVLDEVGELPLPEYIRETLEDGERYQTVYAHYEGSAAAPTAGLHFTPELLETLEQQGIHHTFVTLHVGLGTFRPVKAEDITDHTMHSEHFILSQQAADEMIETKQKGGRVIAVGTTACRTLESVMQQRGALTAHQGTTDIFITPGYRFQAIDGLLTNFHLPMSTLVMLVSAFGGREQIRFAYEEAIKEKYRFYSFGDAMLIL